MSGTPEMVRCSVCGELHPAATMVTAHRNPEDVPEGARGTRPEPTDWWLTDAEALHAEHPRSFFIPPADRRHALRPGELVKLGFAYGPHADREGDGHVEKMWVEVLDQDAAGAALGRLRNRPHRLAALEIGDVVAFGAHQVLSIDFSDEELGYAQDEWPIVDRAVLEHDRAPDVVVRYKSPRDGESETWWMLVHQSGMGPSQESAGLLTDRFPGLAEPLRAGTGVWDLAEGERDTARWRRVADAELAGGEWPGLYRWLERAARELRAG
jgi:hypothetical protein